MSSAPSLSDAARLHAAGDLTAARRAAEAVLARSPRDLAALRFAGALACQTGDLSSGIAHLRAALAQAPGDDSIRFNLAQALLQSNDPIAADEIASKALPTAEFRLLRAMAARQRGDHGAAATLLEQILQANPNDVFAWNALGNAFLELKLAGEAQSAFEQAARLRPQDQVIRGNLLRAKALRSALSNEPDQVAQLLEQSQHDAPALVALGETLIGVERWQEALAALGSAARLNKNDPRVFTLIGIAFEHVGDREKAEQSYRFALRNQPFPSQAFVNLGLLLENGNRLDELEQLIAPAEQASALANEVHYLRALLLRRRGQIAEALAEAERVVPGQTIDVASHAALLGQLHDRLGEPEKAFAQFTAMHRAKAQGSAFSGEEGWREVDGWFAALDRTAPDQWRDAITVDEPPSPAFLLGFMRSGTTLLDTMLMGHPDTHVLEELPIISGLARSIGGATAAAELDRDSAERLRKAYGEELQRLSPPPPGALVIDKFPMATLHAPLIHRLFPDARFLFALRHPCDVVLSCFMQNFRLSTTMASFLTIENAARYYAATMRFWSLARERLGLDVHTVKYERLLDSPEDELRALTDYLGLRWEPKLLEHQETARERGYIRTPSYHQVTQGLYQRSRGRWLAYRAMMEPALPILAPWIERFGYEPLD